METLDLQTFRAQRRAYDDLVARTDTVDLFCTSSYWILPALGALFPEHEPWIRRAESTGGYIPLARGFHSRIGHYLQPMEASWGLAAPMAGEDLPALIEEFGREVRRQRAAWDMLFLSGVYEESRMFRLLVSEFRGDHVVGVGPAMSRHIASLEGGFAGWFGRRSSKFRANIRRARRAAAETGLQLEYHADFPGEEWRGAFARIVDIESRSWKGKDDSGIATGAMNDFYRRMTPMLAGDGALRVSFVTLDGTDIAYCFGGIIGDIYRGLQLSYDSDYKEHSAGNLAQIAMIEGLCEEGIGVYDMGQAMDYKSRWAETKEKSIALVIR